MMRVEWQDLPMSWERVSNSVRVRYIHGRAGGYLRLDTFSLPRSEDLPYA